MGRVKLAPSILAADFSRLGEQIDLARRTRHVEHAVVGDVIEQRVQRLAREQEVFGEPHGVHRHRGVADGVHGDDVAPALSFALSVVLLEERARLFEMRLDARVVVHGL